MYFEPIVEGEQFPASIDIDRTVRWDGHFLFSLPFIVLHLGLSHRKYKKNGTVIKWRNCLAWKTNSRVGGDDKIEKTVKFSTRRNEILFFFYSNVSKKTRTGKWPTMMTLSIDCPIQPHTSGRYRQVLYRRKKKQGIRWGEYKNISARPMMVDTIDTTVSTTTSLAYWVMDSPNAAESKLVVIVHPDDPFDSIRRRSRRCRCLGRRCECALEPPTQAANHSVPTARSVTVIK